MSHFQLFILLANELNTVVNACSADGVSFHYKAADMISMAFTANAIIITCI